MSAAQNGASEAVEELLQRGANPNALNRDGDTALTLALSENSSSVISMLAPVTCAGAKRLLNVLGERKIELTEPIKDFIERAGEDDQDVLTEGLKNCPELIQYFSHLKWRSR